MAVTSKVSGVRSPYRKFVIGLYILHGRFNLNLNFFKIRPVGKVDFLINHSYLRPQGSGLATGTGCGIKVTGAGELRTLVTHIGYC